MANLNIDPVNFSEQQASKYQDFGYEGNTLLYRIGEDFSLNARYKNNHLIDDDTSEDWRALDSDKKSEQTFVVEHCKLLEFKGDGDTKTYSFNKGEVYLYARVELDESEPDFQLIPLAPSIDSIVTDHGFVDAIKGLVNDYSDQHQYITRNQLRIRSNNIQAWVVNNFIAKSGKGGEGNYTPGTIKISDTDNNFDYIKNKITSSDNSIEFEVIGRDNTNQKLDIRSKINGIAFADVVLSEIDWVKNGDYYEIEFKNSDQVKDAISNESDYWYTFIKNVDTYIRLEDNQLCEFSVDRIYAEETITLPGIEPFPRKFLKKIRAREAHNVNLVLYLTNGTVAKDSGEGGIPTNYLIRAAVSQDNKTLALYPNQGDVVNFKKGAESLSELTDFSGPSGQVKLNMLNSFLNILTAS